MPTIQFEDQTGLLDEALGVVKVQSYQMQRCLEEHKLMDGLKHCSTMLAELRTSALTPKNYYELYLSITDAMRHLVAYLKESHSGGRHHLADLYELVQYAGNIVPRLYLMITVGSVYLKMPDAPVKEILRDMMEMSRGIQHPTRGLFLRHFLSGMTREGLPVGRGDGPEGNLDDSVEFILTNFVEMNKLWVRLQHLGHSRDREKREMERKELRILVGTNLVRLSQLEGVDLEIYNRVILPGIMEQVVNCKDVIAQEYLMEVITQVFPDEFHLRTLDPLMKGCLKLHPKVSVRGIVIGLLDRLVAYSHREAAMKETEDEEEELEESPPGIPDDVELFNIFWVQIQEILRVRTEIGIQDVTAMMHSLANLSLSCYPTKLEHIDQIFSFVVEKIHLNEDRPELHAAETTRNLLSLLKAPIQTYPSVLTVLDLEHYPRVLNAQSYPTRRAVAHSVLASALKHETLIETAEDVNSVLGLCAVLIKGDGVKNNGFEQEDEVQEEQGWLGRLVHLFRSESADEQFLLLSAARKQLSEGGVRVRYTFPPLVFSALKLAKRYKELEGTDEDWAKKCSTLFRFIHQLVVVLETKAEAHDLSLRLFLSAGLTADHCGFEEIAYDFFVQAFTIYEESISESRSQFQALMLTIGALQSTRVFSADNYDNLTTKCLLHAGRLLKRPDQCRALCYCSHLFWATSVEWRGDEVDLFRDGKRVLEILQRALKVADACLDAVVNVQLFVEILNQYIYYFEAGSEQITVKYINGLVDLINTNISSMEMAGGGIDLATQLKASSSSLLESFDGNTTLADYVVSHFKRTLAHLLARKQKVEEEGREDLVARWNELEVSSI